MSTPLKIQKITGLETDALTNLRVFAVTWSNAARLLMEVIKYTEKPEAMRAPLEMALERYMQGRSQGLTDLQRMGNLLLEIFDAACSACPDMTPELFVQWCDEKRIPPEAYIQELRRGRHD